MRLCVFFVTIVQLSVFSYALNQSYLATNRFAVRANSSTKFEARWANRKSKLSLLPGFRYFQLLKRVDPPSSEKFNYLSFTIWEDNDSFLSWRNGPAFAEAHGGSTGIGAFFKMIKSLTVMKGAPKPAMYDALMPVVNEKAVNREPGLVVEDGWRKIFADGSSPLPRESFVAVNAFSIAEGATGRFEAMWEGRESKLDSHEGFVNFCLARRDGEIDDGVNYRSITTWRTKVDFERWRKSDDFKRSHGGGGGKSDSSGSSSDSSGSGSSSSEKKSSVGASKATTGMFTKPPKLEFYEGMLVLSKGM
mgnify:FL=1